MELYSNHIVYDESLCKKIQKEIQPTSDMEVGDSLNQEIDYLLKKYNIYDEKSCVISISCSQEAKS